MHSGFRFAAVFSSAAAAAARAAFALRRSTRRCGFALGASLLSAVVAHGADAPPTFTVANAADAPITWGDVLTIEVAGELPQGGANAASWKVWLNAVPLDVQKVFSTPAATVPSRTFHLVLRRPNLGTNADSGVEPNEPDVVAAIIRGVAPNRFGTNQVAVRLAYDTLPILPTRDKTGNVIRDVVGFRLAHPALLVACAVVMLIMLLILLWAAFKKALLRDYNPAEPDHRKRTFSLSRTQLAFWSVLIIGGYCFLYLVTGQFVGHLNNTVLILLGISVGTTALAGLVGGAQRDAQNQAAQNAAAANAGAPNAGAGNAPAAGAGAANSPPPALALSVSHQPSQGFLTDLLSDSQGVNLHRLQMFVWTLVFGVVFLSQLFGRFAFPVFDQTTFLLMGISSGTYVFFKRAEP